MAYVALVGSACGVEGEGVPFIEYGLAPKYINDGLELMLAARLLLSRRRCSLMVVRESLL